MAVGDVIERLGLALARLGDPNLGTGTSQGGLGWGAGGVSGTASEVTQPDCRYKQRSERGAPFAATHIPWVPPGGQARGWDCTPARHMTPVT